MNSVAFIINGTGLGNAVRCDAVIEGLRKDLPVILFCSNNSFRYFGEKGLAHKVVELKPQKYQKNKNGDISFVKTLVFFLPYLLTYFKNLLHISKVLKSNNVKIVVSDSDYSFVFLRFIYRAKYFAINNSHFVVSKIYQNRKSIFCCLPQLLIEIADAVVHFIFADLVFCPTFSNQVSRRFRTVFLPPIVRRCFYQLNKKKQLYSASVGVLPSGSSEHLSFVDQALFESKKYKILVPENLKWDLQNFQTFGKFKNSIAVYRESDVIVTNAGMSCLSEILVTGIPAVVSPICAHFEQQVNANCLKLNRRIVVSKNVKRSDVDSLLKGDYSDSVNWLCSGKLISRFINQSNCLS